MIPLKQSTALDYGIFCHDGAGDPVLGLVDGDFTKRIRKAAGAFAAMTVTITELELGWYSMTLSASHTDTLGILTIVLTATGMKQVNLQFRVSARLVDDVSTHAAADIWAAGTRTLTAGTNIVLAKGTGVTGFNDPTAGAIADSVWDEAIADHLGAGATGAALNAAGSAGDPWSAALPGAYGAGTAGKIVGDNLDATVSSRATPAQVNTEVDTAIADAALATAANLATAAGYIDTEVAAIKAKTDNLPAAPAAVGDVPTTAAIADAVLDEVVEGSATMRQYLRGYASALFGKLSGAATTTVVIRDVADTKPRITATVTADGDRTAVVTDLV